MRSVDPHETVTPPARVYDFRGNEIKVGSRVIYWRREKSNCFAALAEVLALPKGPGRPFKMIIRESSDTITGPKPGNINRWFCRPERMMVYHQLPPRAKPV